MNPRTLIDTATGRILPAQVMRAAHRRAAFQVANNGATYRAALAVALRLFWSIARTYAYAETIEHSTASSPLPYMGGRNMDGVANERVL